MGDKVAAKRLADQAEKEERRKQRAARSLLLERIPALVKVGATVGEGDFFNDLLDAIIEEIDSTASESFRSAGRSTSSSSSDWGGRGDTYTPQYDCNGNSVQPPHIPGPSGLW